MACLFLFLFLPFLRVYSRSGLVFVFFPFSLSSFSLFSSRFFAFILDLDWYLSSSPSVFLLFFYPWIFINFLVLSKRQHIKITSSQNTGKKVVPFVNFLFYPSHPLSLPLSQPPLRRPDFIFARSLQEFQEV